MSLDYSNAKRIINALEIANNPKKSEIRAEFLNSEKNFFRKHIKNKKVLVAGSGLGYDSFYIAEFNKEVIGVEISRPILKISKTRLKKNGLKNVKFKQGDFRKLKYKNKSFDCAVLNMGTIGNFSNKTGIIKELLRVANVVYLDFYKTSRKMMEKRKEMYETEGWTNVRIKGKSVVSDDGMDSESISKKEFSVIMKLAGGKAKYYHLCDFAIMAEIR